MLKFLADENIAPSVVETLRNRGYDVRYLVEEQVFGEKDSQIISIAKRDNRVILTHD